MTEQISDLKARIVELERDKELFERAYHLAVYKLAREFGTYSKARLTAMADSTMTQALEEARREQKGGEHD